MSGRSSRGIEVVLACALATAGVQGCTKERDASRRGEAVRVAAAADLALAFREVAQEFEATTGKKVDLTFGSTGLLAKQIEEGAPFDVFAGANIAFVDDAVRSGACLEETKRLYAKGRIVVWAKDREKLPKSISELADGAYAKIAIANPEHAPYGRAAQQALTKTGVWATVSPRLVFGQNVQHTLMYADSGNADVAVVALSLAVSSSGHFLPIDPSLHDPLDQAMVVCRGGVRGGKTNEARAFVDMVSSERGRAIMRKYGFLLPGETLTAH
jgi:molybdate transport system substrate-binding protein